MFDFFTSWAAIFMAIVALVILGYDLYMRRKIMKSELELQNKKFDREERERDTWQKWLERERIELGKMYKPLSKLISSDLIADSQWAFEAIQKAKLGSYSQTLFGERSGHFREEKQKIASNFVHHLLSRCKYLIETTKKDIYLIIDSGSTLQPFFELLGRRAVQIHEYKEKQWIDKITIITNNLPGVVSLMEAGRPNPSNRYSGLAINCRLLPGVPLPVYSAVTGKETEGALQNIRTPPDSESSLFIGLTTGNWIRIRKTDPRCPVPLARGERHRAFKQKLLDISDEVFVVSPLGKIFANASNENVNKLLGLSEGSSDPEKMAYEELEITSEKAKSVKIVTTYRKDGRLLQNLSRYIQGQLQISENIDENEFARAPLGEAKNLIYLFDDLPKEVYLEKGIEFPHMHTRKEGFIEPFLHPEREIK